MPNVYVHMYTLQIEVVMYIYIYIYMHGFIVFYPSRVRLIHAIGWSKAGAQLKALARTSDTT